MPTTSLAWRSCGKSVGKMAHAPPRLANLLPRGCHCGGPFVDNHIERTSDLARAAHVLGQQGNDRGFPMQTAEGEMDCRNGSRL